MYRRLILASCILLLCVSSSHSQIDNSLWAKNFGPIGVSGTVKAMKQWGDTLVVAGDIAGLRQTAAISPGFVMFDLNERSWHRQIDEQMDLGDEVRALEVMPNGDLVVGGDFSFTADGYTLDNIAVYRKDGTWSTLSGNESDSCEGPVNALLLYENRLYIGGEFNNIGQNTPNIPYLLAVWGETQGFQGYGNQPLAFTSFDGGQPAVYALAAGPGPSGIAIDRAIYIAGDFVSEPGDTLGGLIRLSPATLTIESVSGIGTNGPVYALGIPASLSYDEKLFVGGEFTFAGGSAVVNCGMHEIVDKTWHALDDGLSGPVYAIRQFPGGSSPMYFAGDFDSSGTTPVGAFPSWPVFGSGWNTTTITTDDPVQALEGIDSDFLAVGGEFEYAGDSGRYHGVFQYSTSGSPIEPTLYALGDGLDRDGFSPGVNAVAADDSGNFYVTGGFDHAGGKLCNNIAKWDGETWHPLGDGLEGFGLEIAVSGDTVYVVHALPFPNSNKDEVLRWDGSAWAAISPELPNVTIRGFELDTLGNLYLVGRNLDTIGFSGAHGIIKWDGTQWLELGGPMSNPSINPLVNDIYIDSLTNEVYICGQFQVVDGVAANNVAMWNGTFWTGLGNVVTGEGVPHLIGRAPEGEIVIAGFLDDYDFRIQYQSTAWIAYAGGRLTPGSWTDLLTIGCHLYATGDPLQFVGDANDPMRVYNIGRWDGLQWDSLGSGTNGGVFAIAANGNQLAVAGDFTIAGGKYARGFTIWNGVIDGAGSTDLTLLTPTMNDTLEYGTVYDFTWDTATTAQQVSIEVSLDSGATWEVIHNRADAKIGRLPWVVPDTNASYCKVRLSDGDTPCAAVEANFTFAITADSALDSWWLTHAGGTYYDEPFLPGYTGFSFSNAGTNMWPDSLWKSIDYSGFPEPPDTIENFPDWYLYCEAYGDDWCFRNGNSDRPRSRAIKHWQSILTDWGGSCLGFSTASLLWLYGNEFNSDLIVPYEPLFYLDYNTFTRNAVNKLWIYQKGEKHLEHDVEAQVLTPYETMVLIRDDFTAEFARSLSFSWRSWEDKLDDDSVVIDSNWDVKGHNVVPYHIRNVPDSQGIYYMYYYDSNDPTSMNRWARIDSINNVWRMSNYQTNDTNCRFIPRLPINDWYGLANDDRVTTGLKRMASSHFAHVYTSATEDVLMTDSVGNQIGWVNNEAVVNGLEGGPMFPDDPDYPYSYPPGYLVPAQSYDIELSNHEAGLSRFSLFTDSVAYFYRRDSVNISVTDRFSIDDGVSIVQPSGLLTGVAVGAIRTTDTTERYFELSEMTFAPIDSVEIKFDSAGAITMSSFGINRAYKLLLWNSDASMADDEVKQSMGYTTIFADETHKIVPAWGMLESMPTLLLKDTDQDGMFEDTSVLAIATDIEDDLPELPDTYELSQNYPNPSNPSTTIDFSLPAAGEVTLEIINVLGQRVKVLVDEELAAGSYSAEWNGTNETGQSVATGIYFYRLTADGFSKSKKMLLLK